MAVIAHLYNVEGTGQLLDTKTIGLRETPFPGDIIRLADDHEVRVIRRTFIELTGDDKIDVELGVRNA